MNKKFLNLLLKGMDDRLSEYGILRKKPDKFWYKIVKLLILYFLILAGIIMLYVIMMGLYSYSSLLFNARNNINPDRYVNLLDNTNALIFVFIIVLFSFYAVYKNKAWVGILSMILAVTTYLIKVDIDKLRIDPMLNFDFSKNYHAGEHQYGDGIKNEMSIGPFVVGDTLLLDTVLWKLDELTSKLLFTECKVIDVFGSVDKRQLRGKVKDVYGDNMTLAQARADYIKRYIQRKVLKPYEVSYRVYVNGAQKESLDLDTTNYEKSRYVRVLWE